MAGPAPIARLRRRVLHGAAAGREARAHADFLRRTRGYRAAYFNLTVDFELGWSVARRGDGSNRAEAPERARRARQNLGALLDLCDRFEIPLTFAVVGHLALDACDHPEPPAYAPSWNGGDWYDADPLRGAAGGDRCAADAVAEILARPAGHELGAHTFTHVDLADPETPREVARYELQQSRAALRRHEPALRTHVFPKNHVAHLDLVREAGFSIYRAGEDVRVEHGVEGLWAFPRGVWLSPTVLRPRDVVALARLAADRRHLTNWFFHLYEFGEPDELDRFLRPVFAHLQQERENGRITATTMREIVDDVQR